MLDRRQNTPRQYIGRQFGFEPPQNPVLTPSSLALRYPIYPLVTRGKSEELPNITSGYHMRWLLLLGLHASVFPSPLPNKPDNTTQLLHWDQINASCWIPHLLNQTRVQISGKDPNYVRIKLAFVLKEEYMQPVPQLLQPHISPQLVFNGPSVWTTYNVYV